MSSEPGRQTRHSFSFGASYDPERVSFGPLLALNDDLLGAGAGYDDHDHADVVLVTWVVSGQLEHTDRAGSSTQAPGDLAITRAGTGIRHSERAGAGVSRFVQAWLRPGQDGAEPSRVVTTPDLSSGELTTVATADDLGIPGTTLRIADLPTGASATIPAAPLRYVFVVSGALTRSSLAEPLAAGDAFEIREEPDLSVTAAVPTQLLVWSFAA